MFKIGEFSQLGQVSTRMLRHYDKLGLLVPNHTDEWTGYRYYTIDQLSRLHRIIALKDLGLKLPDIATLLAENVPIEQLEGMLILKQAELQQEVEAGVRRLQRIEARLQQLAQAGDPSPYEIVVKSVAACAVASVRVIVPTAGEMDYYCKALSQKVYRALKGAKIRPLQPEFNLYHTTEYKEEDLDVEVAIAVHPKYVGQTNLTESVGFREVQGHELVASLIYEGALNEMTPAIFELISWVGRHQRVPVGPLREIHLSGPLHYGEPMPDDELVTELMLPISPIESGGQSALG